MSDNKNKECLNIKSRKESVYNVSEKDFELILEATQKAEEFNLDLYGKFLNDLPIKPILKNDMNYAYTSLNEMMKDIDYDYVSLKKRIEAVEQKGVIVPKLKNVEELEEWLNREEKNE